MVEQASSSGHSAHPSRATLGTAGPLAARHLDRRALLSQMAVAVASTLLAACSASSSTGSAGSAPATIVASPTSPSAASSPGSTVASPSPATALSPVASASPSSQALQQPVAAASSGQPLHVNIIYGTLTGAHAFVVIAADQGFYQEHGIDATVSYAESATAMAALVGGQADFVVGGAVDTIQAIAGGSPLEIVAFNQDDNPYGLFTQGALSTPADLKGKSVAIGARGDTSDISLRIALQGTGLNADTDLTIVPIGNSPARFTALLTGQVDGAILDQQQFGAQAQTQGLNLLVNLEAQHIPYAAGGLTVNASFAQSHQAGVVGTLQALIDGSRYFNDPTNKTAVLGYLAKGLQASSPDDPVVQQSYTVLTDRPHMIPPTPDGINTILQALQQISPSQYGSIAVNQVIDPSYMNGLVTAGYLPASGA